MSFEGGESEPEQAKAEVALSRTKIQERVRNKNLDYIPGTDLNIYFEPYWAETLPNLYNGTFSGAQINNMLPDNVLEILIDSVLTDFTINDDHFCYTGPPSSRSSRRWTLEGSNAIAVHVPAWIAYSDQ